MHERDDMTIYDQLSFIKRRYRSRLRYSRGIISAVPLADIILVIILFMVINSWYVVKPAVTVNLPEAPFVSGVSPGAMVLTLSREGLIFFNDERITLEGLQRGFVRAARDNPGTPLVIEADNRVRHGTIVRIYNMALEAGFEEVAIATRADPDAGGGSR